MYLSRKRKWFANIFVWIIEKENRIILLTNILISLSFFHWTKGHPRPTWTHNLSVRMINLTVTPKAHSHFFSQTKSKIIKTWLIIFISSTPSKILWSFLSERGIICISLSNLIYEIQWIDWSCHWVNSHNFSAKKFGCMRILE